MQQFKALDFQAAVPARALELAVIVPILNERDNVERLLARLTLVLADRAWEVVFVDDNSTDGSAELIERIAREDRRVRLVRRFGRRGLSSAVVEGFMASVAPVLAVIDGDLQHDETILPQLYDAIAARRCELAVATRYSVGGGVGDWSTGRAAISRWATLLARPVMHTSLSDPMSGFFMLRRELLLEAVPRLSSVGYKILLDIVASVRRPLSVAEVSYVFRCRTAGASKLDALVALEYFELLLDKLIGRVVPVKLIMFGLVGLAGAVVHFFVLFLIRLAGNTGFIEAQSVAVLVAMSFNYAVNNRFTYRDRRLRGWNWVKGYANFALACSIGSIANVGVGAFIFDAMGHNIWLGGLAGILVGSVWNYAATRWLTWRSR